MTALLAAAPDLDAVFVASDLMADGALAPWNAPDAGSPGTSRSAGSTTPPSPPAPGPH